MKKILVWGTGQKAKEYLENKAIKDCEIIAFVQTKVSATEYASKPVLSPEEAKKLVDEIDYILISTIYYQQIIFLCEEIGISKEKLVITENLAISPYDKMFQRLQYVMPDVYKKWKPYSKRLVQSNEYDAVDEERLIGTKRYCTGEYEIDYFRFRTFELVAKEIKERGIEGDMAELGVFNGTFAGLINEHFPDRKLYLFDTFEGFDEEEAKKEIAEGYCDDAFIESLNNPSMEILKERIVHFDKCVICKGFFPETVTEEARNSKFAFVSLDVDFEESTYQGLKFFYPRLVEGGYIFLHDYRTYFLGGVKKAVEQYEKEEGIRLKVVPIADRAGTLIIMK